MSAVGLSEVDLLWNSAPRMPGSVGCCAVLGNVTIFGCFCLRYVAECGLCLLQFIMGCASCLFEGYKASLGESMYDLGLCSEGSFLNAALEIFSVWKRIRLAVCYFFGLDMTTDLLNRQDVALCSCQDGVIWLYIVAL